MQQAVKKLLDYQNYKLLHPDAIIDEEPQVFSEKHCHGPTVDDLEDRQFGKPMFGPFVLTTKSPNNCVVLKTAADPVSD